MSECRAAQCQHLNFTSMKRHDGEALHVCTDCGSTLTAKQAHSEHVTSDSASQALGSLICNALNIDVRMVTSLRLTIDAGFPPLLEVGRAVLGDDLGALRNVLEQYQVTPIASTPPVDFQEPTGMN